MKYLKKFEDIKIPINVGDTILGGRFKNKKTLVKKIGKNAKGDITINGKPLLKYRIVKESLSSEVDEYLKHIEGDGFEISTSDSKNNGYVFQNIRIYKPKSQSTGYQYSNCINFDYKEIGDEVYRFLQETSLKISYIYLIKDGSVSSDVTSRVREIISLEDILNNNDNFGMIKSICIGTN